MVESSCRGQLGVGQVKVVGGLQLLHWVRKLLSECAKQVMSLHCRFGGLAFTSNASATFAFSSCSPLGHLDLLTPSSDHLHTVDLSLCKNPCLIWLGV